MAETSTTTQKLLAEGLGTFVLVFFGCGAALISGGDYVATALAFGLTVLVMVYAFGRVSGGHFNPAISVGAALGGRMAWNEVVTYVAAQLAGALAAGLALFILMHGFPGYSAAGNMAQNSYGDAGTGFAWWAAFLLEMLLTAVFLWVVLAVTDTRNEHPVMAPLAIGLAYTMILLASIGATGGSANPARSIGVGVFAGTDAFVQLWLFILAPLLGGAIAGATYALMFGEGSEPVPGSGFNLPWPPSAAVAGHGAPDQYQAEWNQENPTVQAEAAAARSEPYTQAQQYTEAQLAGHEPIIENGWQWDPHSQEWIPAPQQQAQQHAPQQPQQAQPPAQQTWPDQGTHAHPEE
ncbi:aquaporin [Nocardioides panaciterrulae]|uniref:Aquaporin Z n=1 Tax=Nocardioides panaciterrulae TaxID=661492 RepID=A0A7Y9E4E6_9ACTN|nr:aquaporin [Nocardioides panaciterrulae]NYD40827.1 aquaporin Z [Nocardioides panaciterrulae]